MAENVSDHAADRALADLVDAFGHYSDAEMQAFLDATPFEAEMRCGVSPAKPVRSNGWLPRDLLPARS